jgi:hypothetical protein
MTSLVVVTTLKWLLAGAAVTALVVREVVLRRLRSRHQGAWREITGPDFDWKTSLISERRLNRYLRGNGPQGSGDESLGRLAFLYTWIRRGFVGGVVLLWILAFRR